MFLVVPECQRAEHMQDLSTAGHGIVYGQRGKERHCVGGRLIPAALVEYRAVESVQGRVAIGRVAIGRVAIGRVAIGWQQGIEQVGHVSGRAVGVFQCCPVDIAQPAERAVDGHVAIVPCVPVSNSLMINLICYTEQIRIKLQRRQLREGALVR
jgi:hypothetical protein